MRQTLVLLHFDQVFNNAPLLISRLPPHCFQRLRLSPLPRRRKQMQHQLAVLPHRVPILARIHPRLLQRRRALPQPHLPRPGLRLPLLLGRPVLSRQPAGRGLGDVGRRQRGALDLDQVGFQVGVLGEEALEVGSVFEKDRVGVFGLAGTFRAGGFGSRARGRRWG